jgi:AcrR family transcriptional regulator
MLAAMTEPLDRERVIAAARDLVESRGHQALSLRLLAADLGVTAPALYAHVENKADLLRGVASEGFKELGRVFTCNSGGTAIERLEANSLSYIEFAVDHPELFKVMFMFRPADVEGPLGTELAEATTVFASGFDDIQSAIANGDLPDESPVDITLVMWTATHGVASVLDLLGPGFDRARGQALARTVISATIVGLRDIG